MSSTLIELTATIVSSHASTVGMTSDELLLEIQKVHAALKQLEEGGSVAEFSTEVSVDAPAMPAKKSIQKHQIICMECGTGGFKTLSRHLKHTHSLTATEYRKKHGLPAGTALAAKSYSEARRESAIKNNLGDKMTKGREKYQADQAAMKAPQVKMPAAKKLAAKKPATQKTPMKKDTSK